MSPGELVVVRVGPEGRGTQIALLLEDRGARARVCKFRWASRSWTNPTTVDPIDIVGPVPVHDVRRGPAQRALSKEIRDLVAWTSRAVA